MEQAASRFEAIIDGKRVQFRRRLPVKENLDLLQVLTAADRSNPESMFPIFRRIVESWELPGDPSTLEAYGELDFFSEFVPLVQAGDRYMQPIVEKLSGN